MSFSCTFSVSGNILATNPRGHSSKNRISCSLVEHPRVPSNEILHYDLVLTPALTWWSGWRSHRPGWSWQNLDSRALSLVWKHLLSQLHGAGPSV
ncbi:hypothetical protein DPMN_020522 [Dreissena polymorpha]|uniref:Uncharacterized protein n=1 Tax=Dreissena polymorpha TaxID=45954 RepID=A0A9D4NKE3_DREPO|nr:hypothetical protein DPMN_020522 [Dreissena polymorpha]